MPQRSGGLVESRYDWKRFWIPRGGHFALDEDAYLFDPESEYAHFYPSDAKAFAEIDAIPALILLGEPGIGKSDALDREKDRLQRVSSGANENLLYLNLGSYSSDILLERDLFGSAAFREFQSGTNVLHVFLDSLDECRLTIPNIALFFAERFKGVPVARMRLRITCRGSVWPTGLEQAISSLWGEKNVSVYSLAPLRKVDVELACSVEKIDALAFLKEVDSKDAAPFASRPVSLRFLLSIFRRHRVLPQSRLELYRQGCQFLCEESSQSRKDSGFSGEFTPEERIGLAAKIAAMTLVSNRTGIWRGAETDTPDDSLHERDLVDSSVPPLSDRKRIADVLDSGLFRPGLLARTEWTHRTYAEYLTASYLNSCGATSEQVVRLLTHQNDLEGKFPPQLCEVVAWLAAMNGDVFAHVMKSEPEVLMRSDVSTAPGSDISELTRNLLVRYDAGQLFDMDFGLRERYSALRHDGLSSLLGPYISDTSKGNVVRRVAISISEVCDAKDLIPLLLDVALDAKDDNHIRTRAAYAVGRIGDRSSKQQLRRLISLDPSEDPQDELKGVALIALWPNDLSAEDLFRVLTPARQENFFGAYQSFFQKYLVPGLNPENLPVALQWIAQLPSLSSLQHGLQGIVDLFLETAWHQLDSTLVLEQFAETAWVLIERHDRVFNIQGKAEKSGAPIDNKSTRRALLMQMISLLDGKQRTAGVLAWAGARIANEDDVTWLLGQCAKARDGKIHRAIAQVINALIRYDSKHVNDLLEACRTDSILRDESKWLLEAWLLDDPKVQSIRKLHIERKGNTLAHEAHVVTPSPKERVAMQLARSESGDSDAWPRLLSEMTLEEKSHVYGFVFGNVAKLPGWKNSTEEIRGRIISAAKRFINDAEPDAAKLLDSSSFNQVQIAGWPAFELLVENERDFIAALPQAIWVKWTPLFIGYITTESRDEEVRDFLLTISYREAPEVFLKSMRRRVERELSSEHGYSQVLRALDAVWCPAVEKSLIEVLEGESLVPEGINRLLQELLRRNSQEATDLALRLLQQSSSVNETERGRALGAAEALLIFRPGVGWPIVWPIVLANHDFGRLLLLRISSGIYHETNRLPESEDSLADLYIWLEDSFPAREDPQHDGAHSVSQRDQVGHLRDSIITVLRSRGTRLACTALERIASAYPRKEWLKWSIEEARKTTREATWIPPEPKELLALIANSESRIVRTGEELLEAIVLSLSRLQKKLRGATPMAFQYWDEGTSEPKTESRVSDAVKDHLEADAELRSVIVNREVEIRNVRSKGVGDRTDILVQTFPVGSRNGSEAISAVIETKGCWNRELNTAMETQLKKDYLENGGYSFGLYLIAWFLSDRWNGKDYRKAECIRMFKSKSIDDVRKDFHKQAKDLSGSNIHLKAFILDATY